MCSGFWFYLKPALGGGKELAELYWQQALSEIIVPRDRGLTLLEVNSLLGVGKDLLLYVHCKPLISVLGRDEANE